MSSPPCSEQDMQPKPPSDRNEAKQKVLRFAAKKADRPILIGEVSMELRGLWSLAASEDLLKEMVDDGLLREVTPEESRQFDCFGYFRCKLPRGS